MKKLDEKSYHFGSNVNTSSYIQARAGHFSIWLNGGNAFDFKNIDPTKLALFDNNFDKRKELEAAIMELVTKTLDESIDSLIETIATKKEKIEWMESALYSGVWYTKGGYFELFYNPTTNEYDLSSVKYNIEKSFTSLEAAQNYANNL